MVDFVDRVKVRLKAGNGGNGCASIRREKFKPLAGPNGGNGGDGGSIILRATSEQTSLLDYHFSAHRKATSGEMGYGGDKDGKKGDDLVLPVPVGTVLKTTTGEIVEDLAREGQEFKACFGGTGGFGNARISSAQRKAPGFALNGVPGEEGELLLELKLLADVALVGFPSAGKSSVIAAISAARPKIADYPFTTLTPNLGVVSSYGHRFTVADVPGLIPGAADGKGLGLEFLRHIERTSCIVHVIDCATYEPDRDPISDFEAIQAEIAAYDQRYNTEYSPILDRPRIILLNKVDDQAAKDLAELAAEEFTKRGEEAFLVSAAAHVGLDKAVARIGQLVLESAEHDKSESSETPESSTERETIHLTPLKRRTKDERAEFTIAKKGGDFEPYYEITGEKPRRWVLQTEFGNDEAVGYLADRLAKIGIEEELDKMGAVPGAEVRIQIKNNRQPYLISDQEWYIFNYEPSLSAGAEVLYSNRRGEDVRLEYEARANRATRKEKKAQVEDAESDFEIS